MTATATATATEAQPTEAERLADMLAGWDPADVAEFVATLDRAELREAVLLALEEAARDAVPPLVGWKASPTFWRCDREGCDGKPHDRWEARHARSIPGRSQAPPKGKWRTRLIRGGRGSGKGWGASHHFGELIVDSEPGEWACVGPTFGHARDVQMTGPSGLIVALGGKAGPGGVLLDHGPWIDTWNVSTGQLFLTDGSVIYCDGANDGALRIQGKNLRGAWCLAAGTSIATRGATKRVEDVQPGDEVLTREGWRPVRAVVCTSPRAATLTVTAADGAELRCTPNHRLWEVDRGWVEARTIRPGDRLLQARPHGSTTPVAASTGSRAATTSPETAAHRSASTRPYGNRRTRRLSRRATRYIMTTRTGATTIRATSSPSPTPSTPPATAERPATPRPEPAYGRAWPRRGSAAPGEPCGAGGAVTSSAPGRPGWSSTAPSGASGPTYAPTGPASAPGRRPAGRATGAAYRSFPRTGGPGSAARPAVTPISVIAVRPSEPTDVYDLTVEGEHEFFAEGLLVHNCDEVGLWEAGNPKAKTPMWAVAYDESIRYAVRLRPAKIIVSATPKSARSSKRLMRRLLDDPAIPVDTLFTEDNADNLEPDKLAEWLQAKNTRLAAQELYGELMTDADGALVTWDDIEPARRAQGAPAGLARTIVSVDPSFTNTEESDECGIIGAGKDNQGHAYIVADWSGRDSMDGWSKKAVRLAWELRATAIVYESNLVGEVVRTHLKAAVSDLENNPESWARMGWSRPPNWMPPVLKPNPVRVPKEGRLEVVAPFYQQKRVHHCGHFPELEHQLTNWEAGDPSPDRMDACTQALAALELGKPAGSVAGPPPGPMPSTRPSQRATTVVGARPSLIRRRTQPRGGIG